MKQVIPANTGLAIRPLQPTIGAEISGVDLRNPLLPEQRDAIRQALLDYKVVFFRDQHIDRAKHEALVAQLGPLYVHPSTKHPEGEARPAVHNIAANDARVPTRCASARTTSCGTATLPTRAGAWSPPGAQCCAR